MGACANNFISSDEVTTTPISPSPRSAILNNSAFAVFLGKRFIVGTREVGCTWESPSQRDPMTTTTSLFSITTLYTGVTD